MVGTARQGKMHLWCSCEYTYNCTCKHISWSFDRSILRRSSYISQVSNPHSRQTRKVILQVIVVAGKASCFVPRVALPSHTRLHVVPSPVLNLWEHTFLPWMRAVWKVLEWSVCTPVNECEPRLHKPPKGGKQSEVFIARGQNHVFTLCAAAATLLSSSPFITSSFSWIPLLNPHPNQVKSPISDPPPLLRKNKNATHKKRVVE